jgi:tRNA U34 2-thiouridine synthase MnmA/TrmU
MGAIRAVGLLSGGLDSALAARLLLDQGIEVIGLHLRSPTACRSDVRDVAKDLGIRLEIRDKGQAYLELLRHPKHGYGKNMNPCIDCRAFMFRLAQPLMEEFDARFVFTGEVIGQRPMSQMRSAMELIDREAGVEGLILRPLSALLLPETLPEREGWVDRSKLLGISGRSRTEQLELAERYGLRHYMSPGGGCLLTDAIFSEKLRDLFQHTPEEQTHVDDLELLRVGRHFRIHPGLKVVLGRDKDENRRLLGFASELRWLVRPDHFPGPVALVCGARGEENLAHAMRLIARYTRPPHDGYRVLWTEGATERARPLAGPAGELVQIREAVAERP